MEEALLKIIPLVLIFVLGYFLKCLRIFRKEDGDIFLKLVFYLTLPALIFLAISRAELSWRFSFFPLIAFLVIIITYLVSLLIGKLLRLDSFSLGVFLVGTMIMNLGFVLPFVVAVYGQKGLVRLTLFDLMNGLMAFTVVYYIAQKYGENKREFKPIRKIVLSPPLLALIVALIINLSNLKVPFLIEDFFDLLSLLTIPLILFSLGLYFNPKPIRISIVSLAIGVRMVFGLFLGFLFVKIFGLEALDRLIVLICCAAPVGYNTLVFSSLEELDKEFASSLVSFSVLIGIFFIPILIILFS